MFYMSTQKGGLQISQIKQTLSEHIFGNAQSKEKETPGSGFYW